MASRKADTSVEIVIPELQVGRITIGVLGTSPLITNPLSEKARRELLLPKRKKNTTEKQTTAKHDPIAEFRGSVYPMQDGPTLLGLPSTMVRVMSEP